MRNVAGCAALMFLLAASGPAWAQDIPVPPSETEQADRKAEAKARGETSPPDTAPLSQAEELAQGFFYATTLQERETARMRLQALSADDAAAQLALAAAQVTGAFEQLFADLSRHGFAGDEIAPDIFRTEAALSGDAPQQITYEGLRQILGNFRTQLLQAQQTLHGLPDDREFGLRLDLLRAGIDVSGGRNSDGLLPVLALLGGGDVGAGELADLTFRLDRADGYWLEGYTHLLLAHVEFLLAHDFSRAFEQAFTLFFPSTMPNSDILVPRQGLGAENLLGVSENWRIADLISLIHLLDLPVADQELRLGVRQHLLQVIAFSRQNWAAIAAETDNDREWLPGPHQEGIHPLTGVEVTEEQVQSWMAALDASEGALEGELLLPHWRFPGRGFNLQKLLDDSANFDPVLLLTGPGALPYLEQGPVLDPDQWDSEFGDFGPLGFWGTAAWFN